MSFVSDRFNRKPKMRVVIVAKHASSKFGGEAFLPLNYFRLLRSRQIEAWLVVHARTKLELQEVFPEDRDRLYFVPDTWIHRFLYRVGKLLPDMVENVTTELLSSLYTQSIQRRIVSELVHQKNIDVVHEPIPVSPKLPSLMFDVEAPVIIGPMNGGMEYPRAFYHRQSRFVRFMISLGRKLSDLCNYLLPGKLKADMLLVANERTKQALPKNVSGTVIELVENGVDFSIWQSVRPPSKRGTVEAANFVFIGRLVAWKGVDMLLEAFAAVVTQTNAYLEIIGGGHLRRQLEAQAESLGLKHQVKFTGWLSQKDCAARLEQANALVLPSLFDCGGAVVLEAMAMGVPVIATKWGGPADYLDATCGILIEPKSQKFLVSELSNSMIKLANSPELCLQMGLAGQERVRKHFDWERKIDQILEIYQQTCNREKTYLCQK